MSLEQLFINTLPSDPTEYEMHATDVAKMLEICKMMDNGKMNTNQALEELNEYRVEYILSYPSPTVYHCEEQMLTAIITEVVDRFVMGLPDLQEWWKTTYENTPKNTHYCSYSFHTVSLDELRELREKNLKEANIDPKQTRSGTEY